MLRNLSQTFGGYAFSRRELRLLYSAIFLSFLGASMMFPLWMLYAQHRGATSTQLGLMVGAFLLAPILGQIPMGWLIDRWGRVPILLIGLTIHPLLSLLYIIFSSPNELILLRFVEGIALAGLQPAMNAYIADVAPEKHRSEAYGALGATLNAGMFVGPLFGGIIGQYFGFVPAFCVTFTVEMLAVPLVLGHVREPRLHRIQAEHGTAGWRGLFTLSLLTAYAAFVCIRVVIGTMSARWAIWVHDLGGSYTFIGFTFTVFALPQILLGTTAGRLADRRGRAALLLVSGIIAALIYAAYGFITSLTLILILGVVEGVVIVFQQPLAQALLADASPSHARGRAQGMAGSISAVGGAVAALFAPTLYHHARPLPFVILGVVTVIGSGIAALGVVSLSRRAPAGAAKEFAA